ncbi:Tetratricopeptide TPR_2 repeat protein [Operophtera brumata]|uniref:Tetratricopeptide TPR_2 repeat protein n=1 Tax=Operophtera brumata TaxID=104452 RepID=A0A0L7LBG0_OPEBR|nr:Tetratricopeptide TPR_2 repeat protein [Operophtera brumata]
MPPKDSKSTKTHTSDKSSYLSVETDCTRFVGLSLVLDGDPPSPGDWIFLTIFNGSVILEEKWQNGATFEIGDLPLNLKEPYFQALIAEKPLIFLVRMGGGKGGAKDPDPLLNLDNRAGATVDLLPLILGEEQIFIQVPLVYTNTGLRTDFSIEVNALASEPLQEDIGKIPLLITMISAHCLPYARDGTVYLGAVGLDRVTAPISVNFGMSVSTRAAEKIVWASASNARQAANTSLNVHNDDIFIPEDLNPTKTDECRNFYWNAMNRVLVDPELLKTRLSSTLLVELAGAPRFGKIDVRGRYMGFIDAAVLLEPGQLGVTTSTKLLFYNESELPEHTDALLELPPSSAKASARETNLIVDEFGHTAYVVLRFDLEEPLTPKTKLAVLFETIGLVPPEGLAAPVDELEVEPPPDDPLIDVRRIRNEGGALAVHKELSALACRGAVPMNQGIKRTAANRLLMRVRNRFLLWIFGGQEFDKGREASEMVAAAFRVAVTGNYSDGTANAIGWAALHTLHHLNENSYAAFIAAKKMRKSFELPREWKKFVERWIETSGEEEVFWIPTAVASTNPLLIAAAFFLCLRCYKFSEKLLDCVEKGCAMRGNRFGLPTRLCPDVHYLRAASLVLRRQLDKALEVTAKGIKKFGPSAIMSQMQATCLMCIRGWDGECENALVEAEKAGAEICPFLLLRAALGSFMSNPKGAMQRAALAHKMNPSAHSALMIGRIYAKMGEEGLAEQWVAAAVKSEPLLADGWAVLALLAMHEQNLDKARTMLRTARQVGPVSPDIDEEVKRVMEIVQIEVLPESLVKNLCLCDYYN